MFHVLVKLLVFLKISLLRYWTKSLDKMKKKVQKTKIKSSLGNNSRLLTKPCRGPFMLVKPKLKFCLSRTTYQLKVIVLSVLLYLLLFPRGFNRQICSNL